MPAFRKRSPPAPVAAPKPPTFDELVARFEAHGRPFDRAFLARVHEFSAAMHKDQVRRSGEPYLTHPMSVAWLLADLRLDQTSVAVGLLHDVLEDTLTTREALDAEFGAEIGELVDAVTKIGKHSYVRKDEAQAETFRKMILASASDLRVILVKLADRLHNMMTLGSMSPEARRRISQETVEIYAPIANRLGMAKVKGDLEDLAFYYLYPLQFAALQEKVDERLRVGKKTIAEIRAKLESELAEAGVEAEISFRVKRYYSIYQKLRRQGIDISELYDYLAFRIVTPTLRDCYAALGVVHQSWRPIPGRFKDYIAMPKPNLYQSLHTTLLGGKGQPFEVQIRTREMDLIAEEGIAAHWRYKEGRIAPAARRPQHALAAPAARDPDRAERPAELPVEPEARPLSRRGLRLHAQGRRLLLPARRHAARLRLPHPHRPRPPLHRRPRQRPSGAVAHAAQDRRHRRDPHQPGPGAEPRLAVAGGHLAGQEQDPALAQHAADRAGDPDRPAHVREGAAAAPAGPARRCSTASASRPCSSRRASPGPRISSRGSATARRRSRRCCRASSPRRSSPRRRRDRPGALRQALRKLLPSSGQGPMAVSRAGRPADRARQVLPPGAGRRDRRLHHPRPRHLGALERLPERAQPALQPRARDRGRPGPRRTAGSTRSRS